MARVRGVCKGFVAWSGGVSMSLLSRPRPAVDLDIAFISVGDLGRFQGSERCWQDELISCGAQSAMLPCLLVVQRIMGMDGRWSAVLWKRMFGILRCQRIYTVYVAVFCCYCENSNIVK